MYNTLLLVLSSNANVICFARVWYRLRDFNAELPPQEQLPHTHVVVLTHISSRYVDLGGYPRLGHPAFSNCYELLSAAAMLYTTEFGLCILKSGPLSIPPVGISKALRFRIHEWWWKGPDSWGVSPMSESLTPYWCTSQNGVTYRRQCIRRCFHKNVFFAYGCLLKNVRPKSPRHGRR